jgi:hypothetical protein
MTSERRSTRGSAPTRALLALLVAGVVAALVVTIRTLEPGTTRGPDDVGPASDPAAPLAMPTASEAARVGSDPTQVLGERNAVLDTAVTGDAAEILGDTSDVVVLTLAARTKLAGKDAAADPHVTVELGLGAPYDPTRRALARAVTDERGNAIVEVPWSAIETARPQGDTIWARVVEPGYAQRTRLHRLPVSRDPFELAVLAVHGVTAHGRALDASGVPVAARVKARAWNATGGLGFAGQGDAGRDGWFELIPFQPGVYELIAEAGFHGTGVVRALSLRESPVDPIEIRVRGSGVVRGRVRDAHGIAASALDLTVFAASLDDERGGTVFPRQLWGDLELEGRGHTWATVATDADGRFALGGLRDDLYVVRARTKPGSGEPYPYLLTPTPVQSDGAELDLVLERTYLAVRLVDETGAPWKGEIAAARGAQEADLGAWPISPCLLVVPVLRDLESREHSHPYVPGRSIAGEHVFDVREGRSYLVGILGGGQSWRPREVDVAEGAGRVEVVIEMQADVPHGDLVVVARDALGVDRTGSIALRVEDVASGVVVVDGGASGAWAQASWPARLKLPAGTYRVVVSGMPWKDEWHGTVLTLAELGTFESTASVVADGTTRIDAVLGAGARVKLACRGAVRDEDRKALEQRHPGASFGGGIDLFAGRVALRLLREGRWPITPSFPNVIEGSSAAGKHLGSFVELGREVVSEPLPAGRFRLEGRLPGGRVVSRDVELVDGATTDVVLDFE